MLKVAFVCIHNSCRSQMAEGFGRKLGAGLFESYSAGTENYPQIKPKALAVMKEIGIDISDQYPKLLKEIPSKLDILITMGCGVKCPFLPCSHREDWNLIDPSGKSIDEFRKTRDLIKKKIIELISRIRKGEFN